MNASRNTASWPWTVAFALALAAACSATKTSELGEDEKTSSSSSSSSSGGSGVGGEGFTSTGTGGGQGGSCFGNQCSADLKSVITCDGELIEECPPDEACAGGECVSDPCQAAEQGKSSIGCEFWALKPDLIFQAKGACFAAYVTNTWNAPAHLEVFKAGQKLADTGFIRIPKGQGGSITYEPYDAKVGLPPGEVAILFLSDEDTFIPIVPKCPVQPAVKGESGVLGTARGTAFRITSDKPVVAYTILPYGGGPSAMTSATLLLPSSAWDTNYVAINAYVQSQLDVAKDSGAQPSLNILAREDGTEVTVLPKTQIVGGPGVAGSPANTPVKYSLNAGEYVQLSQPLELTGSPIQSNKPVGLWGAAACINVLPTDEACDSAHQQIPPVKAMGSEYAMVRYRNRKAASGEETPPWRVIGAVDGTKLAWTPAPPPGAPMTLNQGDVYEFQGAGPYLVKSQDSAHPIYVASYMTGAQHISESAGEGDPEWVNVVPVDQYLDYYVFFTDPTYPETSIVVTRKRSKMTGQFADVKLDCAGPLAGWQPLGDYEYTRLDLVTGNFQNVGGCSNGRHVIESDAPFGLTVWGWGGYSYPFNSQYVSYAYPAGAGLKPINNVEIPTVPK